MLKSDSVELRRRIPLAGESPGSEGGREIMEVGRRRAGGASLTVTERRREWPAGGGVEAEAEAKEEEDIKAADAVGGEAGSSGEEGRDACASCSMPSMVVIY